MFQDAIATAARCAREIARLGILRDAADERDETDRVAELDRRMAELDMLEDEARQQIADEAEAMEWGAGVAELFAAPL